MDITFRHEHKENYLVIVPIIDGKEIDDLLGVIDENKVKSLNSTIAQTEAAMKKDIEEDNTGV